MELTEARLPTERGDHRIIAWHDHGREHAALIHGEVGNPDVVPLVRLHSECLTGDLLGSRRCDCGAQLEAALDAISKESAGVLLYLRQEGRGIGLVEKIKAYSLQDEGHDTVDANTMLGHPADGRDYAAAARVLRELGIDRVRLLTNNPAKVAGLEAERIAIAARVPLVVGHHDGNADYLATKATRMGHHLPSPATSNS